MIEVKTVAVVGAGTIGRGVASSFAQHGFDVILVDREQAQLDGALAEIRTSLRTQSLFLGAGGRVDVAEVMRRISSGTTLDLLAPADYVVENVTENWAIKSEVYQAIDRICRPGCPFAVNTSAIPITRVGSVTSRPADVLGVHFMNPVPLLPAVEVIRGHFTSDETLSASLALLERIGKRGIVVKDAPGFVTNRVLMLTINEAVFCVQDGVADAESVDDMFRSCFGHKMGPLETGDLIGLDTILNSIMVLYESFHDSKYRPAPLLQRMVDAGLLGRKAGRGFYEYTATPSTMGPLR